MIKGVRVLEWPVMATIWPRECDASSNVFGVEEMSSLVDDFKPLLLNRGVLVTKIIEEWTTFKKYCSGTADVQGSNLATLIAILLLIPVSNAKVKRDSVRCAYKN